jgi:hypothetical protein
MPRSSGVSDAHAFHRKVAGARLASALRPATAAQSRSSLAICLARLALRCSRCANSGSSRASQNRAASSWCSATRSYVEAARRCRSAADELTRSRTEPERAGSSLGKPLRPLRMSHAGLRRWITHVGGSSSLSRRSRRDGLGSGGAPSDGASPDGLMSASVVVSDSRVSRDRPSAQA